MCPGEQLATSAGADRTPVQSPLVLGSLGTPSVFGRKIK